MENRANGEGGKIRGMFDGIARRYDLLNHLLSANLDRAWRRAAVEELEAGRAGRVLDLCGGTGDLTVALARAGRGDTLVCCDFAHGMLSLAGRKFRRRGIADRCLCVQADGLRLPFPPASFDAVTVAFGVRNFVDMERGLGEILRVLAPGGRMVVLEFSTPTTPLLGRAYRWYLRRILPRIGDRLSGRSGPYAYLARTISSFPEPAALAGRIREAGFAACGWKVRSGGIVAIHTAFKRI